MIEIKHILPAVYRNCILTLTYFGCLLTFTGCHAITSVHLYEGPHLPQNQIAKVTVEVREQTGLDKLMSSYPSSIQIKTVDGKKPEDFEKGYVVPREVFVLPGPHTFGIKFWGPHSTTSGAIPALIIYSAEEHKYGPFGTKLEFNTEAGHEYKIRFKEITKPWKGIVDVKYWVEDVNSGQVVLGEKPLGAKTSKKSN
jgi:hypothetical protein